MGTAFRPRRRTILPVLLCLSWAGCSSRSSSIQSATPAPAGHPTPFHNGDDTVEAASRPDAAPLENAAASIPFADAQSLPAGTLLTVRLKNPINAASTKTGVTFEAVVDEPVVVERATVIPRGASVAGRVEDTRSSTGSSNRSSNTTRNRGYVRLTLDQVDIAGRELPIRTSSLFARGNPEPSGQSPEMVSLEQGRQLTFRLAEPVYLVTQSATLQH
jgi:hypothetical protein